MPFSWDEYPYTNFHELNIDWFLKKFKEIFDEWTNLYSSMLEWKQATDEKIQTILDRTEVLINTYETWVETTQTNSLDIETLKRKVETLEYNTLQLVTNKVEKPKTPYNPNGEEGQTLVSLGDGRTKWDYVETDPDIIESSVNAWLDAHPEATTTVEDGSLTESKFTDETKLKIVNGYYTPEMYGAIGDGVTDDSEAIQEMLDNVPLNSVCIFNNNYYCGTGLLVTRAVNIYMYGECNFPNTLEYAFRVYGHGARRNHFRLNLVTTNAEDAWKNRDIIGLDLWACQENTFDVYCESFKTGIRLQAGNTTGEVDCDYNKIFIRRIYNCQYAIYMTGTTGEGTLAGGTVSQNVFIGGRIGVQGSSYTWLGAEDTDDNCYWAVRSKLLHSRTNNNNLFVGVSFEGFGAQTNPYENRAKVTLNFATCMYLNCRYEGITWVGKTVTGINPSLIIGGYGIDDIVSYSGGTILTPRKVTISSYNQAISLERNGSGNRYIEIKSSTGTIVSVFEDKYLYVPQLALLPDGKVYGATTPANSMKLLFEYWYENPSDTMSNMGSGEWRVTDFGHILCKNRAGNKTFDIQPILTTAPTWATIPTGTMAFVNGKPQWYDGTKWVYADGTDVT